MMLRVRNPRCEICRFWSQRLIRQVDFRHGGRIERACLLRSSPNAGQYMEATGHCEGFDPAIHGAVDGASGERVYQADGRAA